MLRRLSEAKLSSSGETDSEQENQTEVAAEYEGELMGLDKMQLDVKAWWVVGDSS